MTKPTPRSELVKAVAIAWGIVDEALSTEDFGEDVRHEALLLQAAALPVILREVLDVEIWDEIKDDRP